LFHNYGTIIEIWIMDSIKYLLVLIPPVLCLAFSGCGTVQVNVLQYPENRSETQKQLDNIECHNYSKVSGPLLFGFGYLIYRNQAKKRFCDCMESRGYVMDR
jgi:hypothetical protein